MIFHLFRVHKAQWVNQQIGYVTESQVNEYVFEKPEKMTLTEMQYTASALVNAERNLFPMAFRFPRVVVYIVDIEDVKYTTESYTFYEPDVENSWLPEPVLGYRNGEFMDRFYSIHTVRNKRRGRTAKHAYYGAVAQADIVPHAENQSRPDYYVCDSKGHLANWWFPFHQKMIDAIPLQSMTATADRWGSIKPTEPKLLPTMLGYVTNQKHQRKRHKPGVYSSVHGCIQLVDKAQQHYRQHQSGLNFWWQRWNHAWGDGFNLDVGGYDSYIYIAQICSVWYWLCLHLGFTINELPYQYHGPIFGVSGGQLPINSKTVNIKKFRGELLQLVQFLFRAERYFIAKRVQVEDKIAQRPPNVERLKYWGVVLYDHWEEIMNAVWQVGQALNLLDFMLPAALDRLYPPVRMTAPEDLSRPDNIKRSGAEPPSIYSVHWMQFFGVFDRGEFLTTTQENQAYVWVPAHQPIRGNHTSRWQESSDAIDAAIDYYYQWIRGAADALQPYIDLLPKPWWYDAAEQVIEHAPDEILPNDPLPSQEQ